MIGSLYTEMKPRHEVPKNLKTDSDSHEESSPEPRIDPKKLISICFGTMVAHGSSCHLDGFKFVCCTPFYSKLAEASEKP